MQKLKLQFEQVDLDRKKEINFLNGVKPKKTLVNWVNDEMDSDILNLANDISMINMN